jgi:hypothetical protein
LVVAGGEFYEEALAFCVFAKIHVGWFRN